MAVRFDAVGDQLNRTANLPPNGSFTYMMWAVIDNELSAGTYQPYIWALDATSQQGYACGVINGIFDIECYNGGVVASSSSVASRPTAGQAACVYIRCSGTGAGLINSGYRLATSNAFVSSGTATLGSLNVMTQLYMGGLFGVYWMDGRKWNIKAWDRALSDAEILAESYFDGVLYPASLNFHLPLTGVNDTADRSGNGRNPTTAGTLTTGDTLVQLFRPKKRLYVPQVAAATNYSLTCDVGSYSLTGIAALLRRGYSLTADVGSYALTGQNAALRRGYSLVCSTGSYAITGIDATLTYVPGPTAYSLTCDVGSYSLTGYDATLTYGAGPTNYSLTCDVGSYSITGYDATLTYSAGAANYSLSCDVGAYALTGIDATLTYTPGTANYTLTCDTGAYALTGVAATLSLGRRLLADTGSYAITGQAATLVYGRRLICATGSYSLTGQDATLVYTTTAPTNYTLACETGAYSISGIDASLIYSGAVVPRRHAGTRKNYIIKGQKYALTDYELALLIQQMLDEVKRPEIQVVTAKEVKQVSRRVWKRLKESLSSLEALTLEKVETVVESNVIEYDDEDDEELLMLL